MVMARIPFDRSAVMMSPRETVALLRRCGFAIEGVNSYFFLTAAARPVSATGAVSRPDPPGRPIFGGRQAR
jgi:hypothetical protein